MTLGEIQQGLVNAARISIALGENIPVSRQGRQDRMCGAGVGEWQGQGQGQGRQVRNCNGRRQQVNGFPSGGIESPRHAGCDAQKKAR